MVLKQLFYRRKSVFPRLPWQQHGTVSLRDMLADSFVDVFLLSKDGMVLTFLLGMGANSILSTVWTNRIQMVDESVCNLPRLMCPVLQILPNGFSGSAGKCHVYAAGTEKECDRSGILLSMGLFALLTAMTARWYQRRMEVGWEK